MVKLRVVFYDEVDRFFILARFGDDEHYIKNEPIRSFSVIRKATG